MLIGDFMNMVMKMIIVGLGAVIGSWGRFLIFDIFSILHFPIATLIVNLVGSLILGFITTIPLFKGKRSEVWRLFWGTGICGGFTTMSTYSGDMFILIRTSPLLAILYVMITLIGGIGLAWAGMYLGRKKQSV
ncbi:fluoride efflux transporter FluC [Peribacillus alkalitolerans]|uniref:fluoride efflux transporter FluC n=1 Tax=Peribacillus alkalitolerans TaxID=1550385 RepID=UPI0013D1AEDE|nr:CrcB family protein [Peribacillus alkalitolerans]